MDRLTTISVATSSLHHDRCTKQHAQTAERNAKSHSSQEKTQTAIHAQSIAEIVSRTIKSSKNISTQEFPTFSSFFFNSFYMLVITSLTLFLSSSSLQKLVHFGDILKY
jgi:hypothetical protein